MAGFGRDVGLSEEACSKVHSSSFETKDREFRALNLMDVTLM
jgi:hypothetical protein